MPTSFNYIITVHNSEDHLEQVINGAMKCRSLYSKIYVVLDGCTDRSKEITARFPVTIIETPDVRETLAINAALKVVRPECHNIILQDDVVLQEPQIEEKILALYAKYPKLGIIGFRHGANLRADCLTSTGPSSETDIVQSAVNCGVGSFPELQNGEMALRQVVYKSPICIPSFLVKLLGGYDEKFAPIHHDDTEYCIRAFAAGYETAVVALRVYQPREWSGCNRFGSSMKSNDHFQEEHMNLIRKLYPETIERMLANIPSKEIIKVW